MLLQQKYVVLAGPDVASVLHAGFKCASGLFQTENPGISGATAEAKGKGDD